MSVIGISRPIGLLLNPPEIDRHIQSFLREEPAELKESSPRDKAYEVAATALRNALALQGIAFARKAPSTYKTIYKKHMDVAIKAIQSQTDAEKFLQKAILASNPHLAYLIIKEAAKKKCHIGFSSALIFLAEKDPSEGRLAIAKLLLAQGAKPEYTPSEGARSAKTIASEANNTKLLDLL